MRRVPLILLACALATPATAQPYSASMAQCAALMQNAAQWVESDENADRLMAATRSWHKAAIARAKAEGVQEAQRRMTEVMDRQTALWEAEGAAFFYTEEFRDWTSYCKAFAKAQNIDLRP